MGMSLGPGVRKPNVQKVYHFLWAGRIAREVSVLTTYNVQDSSYACLIHWVLLHWLRGPGQAMIVTV